MADSAAPPAVTSHPPTNPKYALPELPKLPDVDAERIPLDAFRLAAAKLVADAWGMDAAKIFPGVDVGEL